MGGRAPSMRLRVGGQAIASCQGVLGFMGLRRSSALRGFLIEALLGVWGLWGCMLD
jgi:hypothetical protein